MAAFIHKPCALHEPSFLFSSQIILGTKALLFLFVLFFLTYFNINNCIEISYVVNLNEDVKMLCPLFFQVSALQYINELLKWNKQPYYTLN